MRVTLLIAPIFLYVYSQVFKIPYHNKSNITLSNTKCFTHTFRFKFYYLHKLIDIFSMIVIV
jgi:hypothetical protein